MISNLCIDFDAFRVWGKGSDGNRQQSDCLSIACEGAKKIVFLSKGLFSGFSSYFFGSESSSKPASFESSSESSSKPASPEPSSELSWDAPLEELFGAADVSEKSNSAIGKLGKRKVTDETYTNSSIVTKIRNFFSSKIEQFVQWVVSLFRGNNSGAMAQNQSDGESPIAFQDQIQKNNDNNEGQSPRSDSSSLSFEKIKSDIFSDPDNETLLKQMFGNVIRAGSGGVLDGGKVEKLTGIILNKVIPREFIEKESADFEKGVYTISLKHAVSSHLSEPAKKCILGVRHGPFLEGLLGNVRINVSKIVELKVDLDKDLIKFDKDVVRTDAPKAIFFQDRYKYTLASIKFVGDMIHLNYAATSNLEETWYYPITCDQFIEIFGTLDWKRNPSK
jgi:hypothetical protein